MQVKIHKGFDSFSKSIESEAKTDVSGTVQEILADVRKNGDAALQKYTEKFDKVIPESWLVPESAMEEALDNLEEELYYVLQEASDNIMIFHERQKTDSQLDFSQDGTILGPAK